MPLFLVCIPLISCGCFSALLSFANVSLLTSKSWKSNNLSGALALMSLANILSSLWIYWRAQITVSVAHSRIEGFITAKESKLGAGFLGFFLLMNLSWPRPHFCLINLHSSKSVLLNLNLRNKSCKSFQTGAQSTRL